MNRRTALSFSKLSPRKKRKRKNRIKGVRLVNSLVLRSIKSSKSTVELLESIKRTLPNSTMAKKTSRKAKASRSFGASLGAKSVAETKASGKKAKLNNRNNYSTSVDGVGSGAKAMSAPDPINSAGRDRERKKLKRRSRGVVNVGGDGGDGSYDVDCADDGDTVGDGNKDESKNNKSKNSDRNQPTIFEHQNRISRKRSRSDDDDDDDDEMVPSGAPTPTSTPVPKNRKKQKMIMQTSTTNDFREEMRSAQERFNNSSKTTRQALRKVNNRKVSEKKRMRKVEAARKSIGEPAFNFKDATAFSNAPKTTERLVADAIRGIEGSNVDVIEDEKRKIFGGGDGSSLVGVWSTVPSAENAAPKPRPFSYVPESATFQVGLGRENGDVRDVENGEDVEDIEEEETLPSYSMANGNKIGTDNKARNVFNALVNDSSSGESDEECDGTDKFNEFGEHCTTELSKKKNNKMKAPKPSFNFVPASFSF